MARFNAQTESAAALAVDTGFAWLMGVATNSARLRRVTLGVSTTTAVVPTSQQVTVGIVRTTNAGTTPSGGTINKLDPNSAAATCLYASAFATPPTLAASDSFRAAFNTQSGADLPWEQLEEFWVASGTTNGIAFVNRDLALPAGHKLVIAVEWEE
jgi:hypothetical protein